MKKLSKPKQKTKKNKRTVMITFTQDVEDACHLRERIVDSHPKLGSDYYLIKAISLLRELERLKIRNRKKYDEIKNCSAIWKRLLKHFSTGC